MEELKNYLQLVANVDQRCREIEQKYGKYIACRKGCDTCCRHLSVFAVEAAAIALALSKLAEREIEKIRRQAREALPDGPCPLIENGACLLYDARPIICRTHGLPILMARNGQQQIDFCPKNFTGLTSLPGDAAVFLDRINEALVAVNRLYVSRCLPGSGAEQRYPLFEVLLR